MTIPTLFLLAQAGAPPAQPGGLSMLVPFIAIGVIFYFLILRPQQKKQKETQALVNSLKTGDKIVTNGGIHGMISNVKESTVIVKIADNVKIELDKTAVAMVTKRSEPAAAAA